MMQHIFNEGPLTKYVRGLEYLQQVTIRNGKRWFYLLHSFNVLYTLIFLSVTFSVKPYEKINMVL